MNQYLIVGIVFLVIIALLATNKKLVDTLKNISKIEELRKRILYTLGLLLIYRLGSFVVIPGIDPTALAEGSRFANQLEGNGLLGLLNVFSGGAFGNAAIFALGVMPYITASIIIQLAGIMIPAVQRMQKEGESGRRKMNQWTRLLTILVLVLQGPAYMANLNHMSPEACALGLNWCHGAQALFYAYTTVILIAGTMFIMWLGEKITDKGIGNGISLIIMIGIVARLPHALLAEVSARLGTSTGSVIMIVVELVLLFLVFMATIAVVQAVRKVPVQYAKRIVGNKQYGGVRQYVPLKMNAANVMPIIFAQALMFIPMLFTSVAPGFAGAFSSVTGFWYNFTLAVLVIAFTYFYTAIIINPQMMADDMKRNGGFIPGVKPGKQTVNYIDTIMTRITLPGSVFLAIVAILPALAMRFLNIQQSFAYFYGGTSLLIMVGVILDTLKQIESHLLNRHYDGLMKTGRIQGRY
ncbi:MAG: preprotein translocase subunit SecY [Alistipes sp.]|nr:preprotein translocase subunit SecY [Alistipes sp.]